MCKICEAGQLGVKWTIDVLEGRKSIKQMAEFFGVTVDEAWEHVNEHVVQYNEQEDPLSGKMQKIIDVLETYIDLLAVQSHPDPQTIRALTQVARELRGALMDYAELVGRIQRGQVIVQVQQLEQQVQQLTTVVLEEVCDECKQKILRRLEHVAGST